ncbi:MAG TPA: MotA/TolQ/ExbB proton channel family protein [Longimicrobiales bacterium]|nr:MotA/TolQ/ExbB proton channel family protein [Longimicrobiales bacterium]
MQANQVNDQAMDGFNLMNLFADGGWMMYPLIICSLLAFGVMIAKAWTLLVAHKESRGVLHEVESLIREGRADEALRLAEERPGPVAAILYSGLRRLHERETTGADVEKAVQTAGVIELGFLERGLVVLATIANVAPLLGFLGTVAGMISAFGSIAEAGQVDAALVAGGIKVALITTATGLIIAIPVNIGYNFFVTRIDKLIVDMEEGTGAVLRMIWRLETDGRLALAGAGASATPALPLTKRREVAESIHDARPKERPFSKDPTQRAPDDTQID